MSYLVLSILAYAGVYCGFLVGKIAQEELEDGTEYLKWLLHAIFAAILIVFFYMNRSIMFYITLPLILIIFSFRPEKEATYYYSLAPILLLSYIYNGFSIIAPLVFLYGFPLGSIYLAENMKKKTKQALMRISLKYGGFLALNILFSVLLATI